MHLAIFGVIIILLLWQILVMAASLSKSNCSNECGNVSIPYPFGIGPSCSANHWYTIVCQNSTNPPAPLLRSINMDVLEISLVDGTIAVKQPVSPLNCSSLPMMKPLGISLVEGSPFFVSSRFNRLAVFGCRNEAWLKDDNNYTVGGCMSVCGHYGNRSIIHDTTLLNCWGIDCCQTTIPPRLRKPQIMYKNINEEVYGLCGYAFLVDQEWLNGDLGKYNLFRYSLSNPFDYTPLVLEWEFNPSKLDTDSNRFQCEHLRTDFYLPSLKHNRYSVRNVCLCNSGFEGNPYLPGGGCEDIDECKSINKYCGVDQICTNTEGSFQCRYPDHPYNVGISVNVAYFTLSGGLWSLLFLIGGWKLVKVVQNRIQANRKRKYFERNGGLLLEEKVLSTDNAVEKAKLFSSKELAQATDNYNENRILGRGGQGTVYKGMLADGRIVAVKKSKRVNENDLKVFINEIFILSQVNHRNIVKLLGCCLETEVPILVYEFIPNGTLFGLVHDSNEELQLSWDVRIGIATEVAGALSYLHFAASIPIYHRDIKSANILLDEKYRAKVSDFGVSRSISIDQTHLTTRVFGTFGYLDPQYMQSNQFTDKSDVYSFGVILVELLTGEKPVPSITAEERRNLAMYFMDSMRENRLVDILDARVLNEGPEEEIVAVAKLARRCLQLNGKRRPTMKEVSLELEKIKMLREGKVFRHIPSHSEENQTVDHFDEPDDIIASSSESSRLDPITRYPANVQLVTDN